MDGLAQGTWVCDQDDWKAGLHLGESLHQVGKTQLCEKRVCEADDVLSNMIYDCQHGHVCPGMCESSLW